ncbi:flagellar hook protein FlgE [Paraburkholderia ginsengiterrae]|uniref:Flagellar hook protein FlgE n=1 Tax=Paraburkholderia ginsengiterrae TaxID=1462993 RepID=A0A1A9NFK5_9BURK|nr:flagellar hook protein FlgE [Paraburkholderia ginsengiterrae]OAJ61745.1 flagellar hook protein FlgE [Paraburkholderia ginsengiterrae]OAJ65343.1 flagellar hook protein FlgE [Paraburkholderia ginsengiterrae]
MSYQTGLSGLSAASTDLDVIGNNIANANTVGFKSSTAQFADLYANAVVGAANNQVGIGTRLSTVQQNFSNGTFTTTDQPLDIAINGNGFFQLSNNGALVYSRNGVFHLDKSGAIENAHGLQLMGYTAGPNGKINTGSVGPITIPSANLPPTATKTISAAFNLNSQDPVPANAFNPSNSTSYSYSQPMQIYDSLGGTQSVTVYFVKKATGSYDVYGTSGNPPTPVGPNPTGNIGNITFDSSGRLTSPNASALAFTIPNAADNGATSQNLTLDLTGTTQYGDKNGVTELLPDGNSSGQLTAFSVGQDGTLTGTYSNGATLALGQVVLATFSNPNGLANMGNNLYAQTGDSGSAQISSPGSTNHGVLLGGETENSNVDLTHQLVDLITAQRNYQANAQTIKTQQTVDQTLINI